LLLRGEDPYNPRARMDGTQSPTKIAVSRLPWPSKPNHSETENRKERKAAVKIKICDRSSFIVFIVKD